MSPHGGSDTPSPNLHARLRDVADAIRAKAAVAVPKEANVHLEWAVVENVNTDPPSVDLTPGGNVATDPPSKWSQVSCVSWYFPTLGDDVLVLIDGTDRIVVGTVSSGGGNIVMKAPTITIDASVALLLGTQSIAATLSDAFDVTAGTSISLVSSAGTGAGILMNAIGGQGAIDLSADMMGFFRTNPVAQISGSTLFTAADIINALQTYGIFGP